MEAQFLLQIVKNVLLNLREESSMNRKAHLVAETVGGGEIVASD